MAAGPNSPLMPGEEGERDCPLSQSDAENVFQARSLRKVKDVG